MKSLHFSQNLFTEGVKFASPLWLIFEDACVLRDMFLKFKNNVSLFVLDAKKWSDCRKEWDCGFRGNLPAKYLAMLWFLSQFVTSAHAAELSGNGFDNRLIGHRYSDEQLISNIVTAWMVPFIDGDVPFSIKQSCNVRNFQHSYGSLVNDGIVANSEKTRCPASKEARKGNPEPSKQSATLLGVCNEQMLLPKGKVCSDLRRNTESEAEMTPLLISVVSQHIRNNNSDQRYSGYDTLNISQSEVFTAANFAWKQIAINVVASGLEIRQNSGKEGVIKLVKNKLKNAMRTAGNNFSEDLYSDGTAANQINGMQALVADAGTGTVGGINSTTYTFWKNKVQSAAAPLQGGSAITPSSTTIESLMLPLWLALTRNNDHPDLIVMDDTYYTYFEQSQTSIKRYTDETKANAGFVSLKYKGADVVYDSLAAGMPDAHAYFLNTNYIGITGHRDAWWTEVPEKSSVNQDAQVLPIITQCNVTVSNRSLQGVMKA